MAGLCSMWVGPIPVAPRTLGLLACAHQSSVSTQYSVAASLWLMAASGMRILARLVACVATHLWHPHHAIVMVSLLADVPSVLLATIPHRPTPYSARLGRAAFALCAAERLPPRRSRSPRAWIPVHGQHELWRLRPHSLPLLILSLYTHLGDLPALAEDLAETDGRILHRRAVRVAPTC